MAPDSATTKSDQTLVIKWGTFAPNAAELVAASDTVLITHEHLDHFDEDVIDKALGARSEQAMQIVHGRVEMVLEGSPGSAAHLAACGPFDQDLQGLIAAGAPS